MVSRTSWHGRALRRRAGSRVDGPAPVPVRNRFAPDDYDCAPFRQRGGLGKAHQLFGEQLPTLLDELDEVLVT